MAVEIYLYWHRRLSSPAQKPVLLKLRREGTLYAKPDYRRMSVSLKRPEAGAEILQHAANLSGKVLHEFAARSKPLEETEYQARSGVPVVTPSVSDEF
jgi:hypothetical protein